MRNIHYTRKYKVVLCPACDEIQVSVQRFKCKYCNKKTTIISSGKAKFPLSILNSYHTKKEAEEVCKHLKEIIRGEK